MRIKNNNAGYVGASFVVAVAILAGSILLLRNRENVATFYPSDCVGSWKYADRAEGEIQEPTKHSEVASYSAILSNSSGDIYCGNFTGEIPAEKIPETFILGLSLRAFPEGKIKDMGPTEEKSEGKDEGNIEKEIEDGLSPSVDDILEGGGNINEIPEKEIKENITEEGMVDTNTEEETIEESESPISDPIPVEPTPDPEPEPIIEETSLEPEPVVSFWKKIIKVARAEETPVDLDTEPDPVIVEEPAPDQEPMIIEETPTDPVAEDLIETGTPTNDNQTEETAESEITEELVDDIVDNDEVVEDIGGEETQSKKDIRKEEKAEKKEDKQKARIVKKGEDTSTPYLKVFISLDGYNWQEIGVVTYNTLPNPIFEIDKSLIRKWENIDDIQIRIAPISSIDNNLEFFLDGMFVDVVHNTLTPIYDAPEVFIKDPQDIVEISEDFSLNQNPSFIISEPRITVDEAKDLISQRKADVLEDKRGVLDEAVAGLDLDNGDEYNIFNQTVEQKKEQVIIKTKNALEKKYSDETEIFKETSGTITEHESNIEDLTKPETSVDEIQIEETTKETEPAATDPIPEEEPDLESVPSVEAPTEAEVSTDDNQVEETPSDLQPTISFWKKIIKVARAEETLTDTDPSPAPDPVTEEEVSTPESTLEETPTDTVAKDLIETVSPIDDSQAGEITESETMEEVVDGITDNDDESIEEEEDDSDTEDEYIPETIQLESPLNYLLDQEEDVIFLEDIEKPEDINIVIFDPYGDIIDIPYTFKKVLYKGIEKTQIVVEKNQRDFKPGKYIIEVSVDTPQAKVITQQDFSWGVLAVNFDRSVYSPEMISYIQMGVLDDGGRTICDADLTMYITDPEGNISTLSTDDGSIIREEECGPDNVISVPDYYAYYDTGVAGEYNAMLSATTRNGQKTIKDSFSVNDSVVFDIERIAPTRINPKAPYPVTLHITATEDWAGTVIEKVPLSFDISDGDGIGYANIIEGTDEKEIRWGLSLTKGETVTIGYTFKAPLISPELFLIGPLAMRAEGEIIFEEERYWQIASDSVTNNGVMYYGDTNASSQGVVRARVFTNPSTFATEINGATSNTSYVQWVRAETAPTREEIMIGTLKVDGTLYIETCTDGCDANGDYTAQWNNPGTSATQTCNTGGTGSVCQRVFDIAYESLSGRAMVVYSDNTSDKIYYALWDGSSWSPDSTPGTPSATNELDIPGSAGLPISIEVVPQGEGLDHERTDRMMVFVAASNQELYVFYWDGSSFDSGTNISSLFNTCEFAICYGGGWTSSDDFIALSYNHGLTEVEHFLYEVGTGWGSAQSAFSVINATQWLTTATSPTSSRFIVAPSERGNDGYSAVWRGDDSTNSWSICSVTKCPDPTTETVSSVQTTTSFERFNGEALYVYNDSGSPGATRYFPYTPPATWAADSNLGISKSDDAANIRSWGSPNDDDIMIALSDVDCDLYAQLWTGSGLASANNDIETDLTTFGTSCPGYGAPTTDPIGAAISYDFTWKMYSPWSRNWRFYSDFTSNTPSTGIAAENTTATGVSPEDFIRLRYQFVETGGMDGADLRKKLQWTTDDPDSTTATWTDVGDAGETSAVWRYATSGETCGSCSDNTAVATSNLTGSTETGAYISDKDATAGSNMDNSALDITEYDYPLKAENISSSTTYYFRAYDVDMVTPVWRYQESGSTDCLSSTCAYPSVTTAGAGSSVSGTVYLSDEVTTATTSNGGDCDGSTTNVSLRVNGGSALTTTCSNSDGTFSFSSVTVSAGDTISIYTTGTQKANLVYISDGDGDIGMDLYYDTISVGHENAGPIDILDLLDYDSTTDDTNMLYDAVDSTPDTLTAEDGVELHIRSGSTFTPGGTITTSPSASSSSKDGDVHIDGTGTLSMESNTLSVGGDFNNEGTFSYSGSQTTIFTATATGHTITDGGENFDSVTFNGSGGGWGLSDSSTFDSTLTMTAGTFTPGFDLTVDDLDIGASGTITLGSTTLTLTGTDGTPLTNSGTFNEGTSTVIYTGNNSGGDTSIASSVNYYNLSVNNSAETYVLTGTTTVNAAGTTTVTLGILDTTGSNHALSTGKIVIADSGSAAFNANGSTVTLTGTSGILFTREASGAFNDGTSSVEITGSGDVNITDSNTTAFYDMVINGSGTKTLAGNVGIDNTLTVSTGIVDPDGNVFLGSGTNTLTVNSATIKVDKNGGDALGSSYSSFETVTLNTGSTVDFDENANQGLGTYTYDNVLISSATATKLMEQSTTINGTLTMQGGSNFSTQDDTYDLNVGSIDIQAGTFTANGSTITITGDFSNAGTFTAGTSSVIFNGANTATISGTTSFYDLTLTHTAAKQVNFSITGGAIYTVTNDFTVTGSSGNLISIRSTSGGSQFNFNPTGTASVDYADVQDGGCEVTAIQMSPTNSVNSGNNDSCWFDASLTFSISDTTIGFGPLTILNARWATGDLNGSSSDTAAHTFSIQTSAASGYSLTYYGDILKSGTDDIDVASITNDADGDPGITEAFGLSLSTDGSSTIASGYDHNATPASRDWSWVPNTLTEIVSKTSPVSSTETISAYYIANISSLTVAGDNYSTDVTYVITGNF